MNAIKSLSYDDSEDVAFIVRNTGLDKDTVIKVLESELVYIENEKRKKVKIMQCDRCEKAYEPYTDERTCNQVAVGSSDGGFGASDSYEEFGEVEVYDLCPKCLEKFKIFIKSGKNEPKIEENRRDSYD